MEKAHVAAGGPFCGVRRRPKFIGVFTQFCPSPPASNWISVGDRITGLFPSMYRVFSY